MREIDKKLRRARELSLLALLMLAPPGAGEQAPNAEQAPQPLVHDASCGDDGMLVTRLFGSIAANIDWLTVNLQCESMPRPNGAGIRLRFTGAVANEKLAFIIALPGLEPGQSGTEYASNITVTVEGSGRFFSSSNLESCWTDITSQPQSAADDGRYTLSGTLYCVTPLGELNGDAAVSVPELKFVSTVNWGKK